MNATRFTFTAILFWIFLPGQIISNPEHNLINITERIIQTSTAAVELTWEGQGNVIIIINKQEFIALPSKPLEVNLLMNEALTVCVKKAKYTICADYFLVISEDKGCLTVKENTGSAEFIFETHAEKQKRLFNGMHNINHLDFSPSKYQEDIYSYTINGRKLLEGYGTEIHDVKEEGIVVLNISVDSSGKVTGATPNLKESTTTSQYLINISINDVMKNFRFEEVQNSSTEDRGKVRYVFQLK